MDDRIDVITWWRKRTGEPVFWTGSLKRTVRKNRFAEKNRTSHHYSDLKEWVTVIYWARSRVDGDRVTSTLRPSWLAARRVRTYVSERGYLWFIWSCQSQSTSNKPKNTANPLQFPSLSVSDYDDDYSLFCVFGDGIFDCLNSWSSTYLSASSMFVIISIGQCCCLDRFSSLSCQFHFLTICQWFCFKSCSGLPFSHYII